MKLTPIEKKLRFTQVEESKTDKLISALVTGIDKTNETTKKLIEQNSDTVNKILTKKEKPDNSVNKLTQAIEKTNILTKELIASSNSILGRVVSEISRQPKVITPEIIFPPREKRTMEIRFIRTGGLITKARVEEL